MPRLRASQFFRRTGIAALLAVSVIPAGVWTTNSDAFAWFRSIGAAPMSAPRHLKATPEGDGIRVSWHSVRSANGYTVLRLRKGHAAQAVNTVPVTTDTLLDVGLRPGVAYSYRVIANGKSITSRTASRTSSVATATAPDALAPYRALMGQTCPTATTTVATSAALATALSTAVPGTSIALAPGEYAG